jgi:hypothetical protein
MGWQVPSAVIALKQGAGRLIRDVHDRGVLMLCDPRLTGKGYGKLFLASVPPMPRTRALSDVQAFFDDAPAPSLVRTLCAMILPSPGSRIPAKRIAHWVRSYTS